MPSYATAFSSTVSDSWNFMLSAFRFYSVHILTIFLTMVVSKMVRNDDFTASVVGIVPRMFAMPDESASSSLAERDELKENLLLANVDFERCTLLHGARGHLRSLPKCLYFGSAGIIKQSLSTTRFLRTKPQVAKA